MTKNNIHFPTPDEIEQLTKELVRQNTVTLSRSNLDDPSSEYNESRFALFLKQWFDERGVLNILQELPDGRKNVFAFVGGASENTMILAGHFDTVPVTSYEQAGLHPFEPDILSTEQQIDTGKFVVGRGSLDMKSGIAVAMLLMKYWNENKSALNGSALFVAVCDEENNSYGILNAIDILLALQGNSTATIEEKRVEYLTAGKKLKFLGVINVDYTTERFPGDSNYHVWAGTVGKVLLCASVRGKETHAGEPFAGFHAAVLLARIIAAIDGSMKFAGSTVPPTLLQFGDQREEYNVMTTGSASAYMNICTVGKHPAEILQIGKETVASVVQEYLDSIAGNYSEYCKVIGIPENKTTWNVSILSYSEIVDFARQKLGKHDLDQLIASIITDHAEMDDRKKSFAVVEKLHSKLQFDNPVVVLFYAPPFYPYVRPDKNGISDVVKIVASDISTEKNIAMTVHDYYPYISDMSYLSIEPEIAAMKERLTKEMPVWGKTYTLPLAKIEKLQLPVVNVGPHGYGAHQTTERVSKYYSFSVLPEMIDRVVRKMFSKTTL